MQEENIGLRTEINVLREREQSHQDRQRDRTNIENELIQEMQVMKNDNSGKELKAQLIVNERRAVKAEGQVERLQMELQMLQLDSSVNKSEITTITAKT